MAMVGSSPATQNSSRPSWSSAPQSSTPPEAEENLPQPLSAMAANLHGAIGEHRRNSRSSSVSSGGSSGNGGEAGDSTRQQAQARLSAMPQPSPADPSLEQQAKHILQHLDMHPSGDDPQDLLDKDKAAQMVGDSQASILCGKQEANTTEADIVSQLSLLSMASTCTQSPANTVQLGHLMDAPRSMEQQAFSSGVTGPASGTTAPGPFSSSNPMDMVNVVGGYVQNFQTRVQNDFDVMGLSKFFDKYQSNSGSGMATGGMATGGMATGGMTAGAMGGAGNMAPSNEPSSMGSGFQTSTSPRGFQNVSSGFGHGSSQQFMNNSNPFPPMGNNVFSSGQNMSMSNRGSSFYSPVNNYSSGSNFFSGQNSSNNYFSPSQMPPFQTFASPQDFSLPPPPPHGWHSGPFSPNMSDPIMDRVMCRGCQKPYKWPMTLDCMHVFCFNCISNKINGTTQTICCPFCNRTSSVPQGPQKLLLDYALCRYMINKLKMNPFFCTSCSRENEAVICCTTCPAYLCHDCQTGHGTMRLFSSHKLDPITKVVINLNGEFEPMCERHYQKPLTKYCVTCPQMICDDCTTDHLHPDSSNNHDLQESYNIVIARLRNWNEDACIKHKEVLELKKKIPDIKNSIENKKRVARRNVDDYADYLKNVIEQNRAVSHDMVERAAEQMESQLNKFSKLIDDIESELEAVSSFNTFSVDEGTPSMVMTSLINMESSYKRAVAEYSEICQKHSSEGMSFEFTFNPDYPRTNEFIQENFSTVTYKINDSEFNVGPMPIRTELSRGRNFPEFGHSDNPDCNYQRWSAAPDSMSISTWNSGNERDRKGTFIPFLNRCRTRTSFVHVFGDYGRGEYAFTEPSGQAYFEDGSYVICDTNNHRIVYYNKDHEYVRSIGQPPNLPALSEDHEMGKGGQRGKGFTRQDGYLYFPNRVAICPVTKHIVATERPPSHDVQIFTIEGDFVRCFGGSVLQHPRGVTVDENGVIIVVECKVMKLTMFDHDGNQLASHSLAKDLEFPNDVAAKDGKIYISDNRGHCVQVFDYDAKFLQKIGNDNLTYFPIGVSINYLNQIVVTDNHNTFNITVFDLEGRASYIFESITKHAQCHNVAVHPTKLELMLTTKDCNVYFFNYDPNSQHPPQAPTSRGSNHFLQTRRARSNGNGNHSNSSYY
ncbi:B-box type zinc finger protein ncl-1 isoform X2 [Aplysia californica]|nr:B-box type zinc finger protein ncl-1 isoform X2 [Aplysia californica]